MSITPHNMNSSELRKILLEYLSIIPKEHFCRKMSLSHPHFTDTQWEHISDRLQQFCSHCKDDTILLLFPYMWNHLQDLQSGLTFETTVDILWERGFKQSMATKENLKQMCLNWSLFEKDIKEFSKENQQLLEQQKLEKHSKLIEYER